ncbi:hypothetical protein V6N13_002383 [Hibiscus sabdariffa]|uniref:Uncharacterized protein n=1 Tax=Hibiscus sabdariffa TaxID=183260 RepID=A0ABR2C4L3_9ROSI
MLQRFDAIRGDKTFDLVDHPGFKKLWLVHLSFLEMSRYSVSNLISTRSEFGGGGGSYQMIMSKYMSDMNGPKVMESEKCIDYAHNVVQ